MVDSRRVRPRKDPWTVAIYPGLAHQTPLGGGIVIDQHRVLTCRHVITQGGSEIDNLWIAFPKAGVAANIRRRVAYVRSASAADLAVLALAEPVPLEVTPAPLLLPEAADIVDEPWWAFGFPMDAPFGSDAHGTVGAALSYGWVRLETESRYVVKKGFSGTGIWLPRYEAVVGLIGQAQQGGERSGDAGFWECDPQVVDL